MNPQAGPRGQPLVTFDHPKKKTHNDGNELKHMENMYVLMIFKTMLRERRETNPLHRKMPAKNKCSRNDRL